MIFGIPWPFGFKLDRVSSTSWNAYSCRWVIEVIGAPGTLYAGETYQLQIDFPEHYPMEAPQVTMNQIPFVIT